MSRSHVLKFLVLALAFQSWNGWHANAADIVPKKVVELGKMTYISVISMQVRRQGPLLQIQSGIRNDSRSPQQLYYRMEWYDSDGFVVGEDAWKAEWIQGKAIKYLQLVAPSPKVQDFKLYLNSPDNLDLMSPAETGVGGGLPPGPGSEQKKESN